MTIRHFTKEKYLILLLAFIIVASGLDLITDLSHGIGLDHILKETAVFVLSSIAIICLIFGLKKQTQEINALKQELVEAKNIAKNANENVLVTRRELSKVIAQQFSDWDFTESEQEVAWLLLKGLSLKEIAALRNTAEKTVRQQASTLYRKAAVTGRHSFAAWFTEDLL